MRVLTWKRIADFGKRHPDAVKALQLWHQTLQHARWSNLADVRRVYPHADLVTVASGNRVTVFNIAGNKYRLVAAIHYNRQLVFVLLIMTHAEYSRDKWKLTL